MHLFPQSLMWLLVVFSSTCAVDCGFQYLLGSWLEDTFSSLPHETLHHHRNLNHQNQHKREPAGRMETAVHLISQKRHPLGAEIFCWPDASHSKGEEVTQALNASRWGSLGVILKLSTTEVLSQDKTIFLVKDTRPPDTTFWRSLSTNRSLESQHHLVYSHYC